MTYQLNEWTHPKTGATRLYINGSHRKGVYLYKSDRTGRLVVGSRAIDTPHRFQRGNHYSKVNKDNAVAADVAEHFHLTIGEGSEGQFDIALRIARGEAKNA